MENNSEQTTPKELAAKLNNLLGNPLLFTKEKTFSISEIKILCPELYDIIDKAYNIARSASKIYRDPLEFTHVTITNDYDTRAIVDDDNGKLHCRLKIGTRLVKAMENIDEVTSIISHESGHSRMKTYFAAHKNLIPIETGNDNNLHLDVSVSAAHCEEYFADRHQNPMHALEVYLSMIIDNKKLYNKDDKDERSTHPSLRSRIEATLKRLFLDDIFKLNGEFNEYWQGKRTSRFNPRNIDISYPVIQNLIRDRIKHKKLAQDFDGFSYAEKIHGKKPATEDGQIILNYPRLEKIADKQINTLLQNLSKLASSNLDKDKKHQWLAEVKEQAQKFKSDNKIEILEMNGFRLTNQIANNKKPGYSL